MAHLSSWASRQQPLAAWLTEEIRVPGKTFSYWLARNNLVLLLDGLDEVDTHRRDACAEAINAFRREHGLTGIAVCCLTSGAEKLATRLELDEAIELEPPTDAQVDSYLEAAGTPVATIRDAIAADEDLRDLLRAPLMLHVATRAYDGPSGTILQQPGSPEERQQRLWNEYVDRMFERRPVAEYERYTQEQAISWLEWLADTLRQRSETKFYLDRLALEWLPPRTRRRWRYVEYPSQELSEFIRPVEELHWSWSKFRSRFDMWTEFRSVIVLIIMLIPAYVGVLAAIGYSGTAVANQRVSFLVSGTALGLSCVAIALLSLGWTTELRDTRSEPNEGIRRSARNGLAIGLPAAALFGLIFGLADEHFFKLGNVLLFGFVTGLTAGLLVGLTFGFGACLAHYIVRVLLVRSGVAPWHYQQFLEAMTDRQLMCRSGGSYLFAHWLLRDHLADQAADHTAPSPRTVTQ